ncbi:glycosylphosphatidylinositol synthesis N-acetylglucosaminyltransferase complex, subunit PIG-Q/GPI1 [Spathaspora passalidarum NRRL Y-27907]|uniref:Glycosylphosphatidylinositol synthesis N-acetylglucosaminyltransferase complex, subunit PIG-Q/GPI1 n=1 Tax=Spathaspora passalidarum (strain NRRL Y-27907 / 11-Y1) TaxID=619300 RepID=G3AQ83_SPAPN|nr:glycosylphosphatidylinositol synthesis N-acetylglucosaminyltransferase complex, subunit PIG-Q/GPI1 [Spathaspora passalidarum NRRL Y-27907]EGW31429.1 glycosylphosphatidylinositol synthesis N-acetylglucosaminyltransferase complex, subunit PIG-Q/GPI1 [Spathaspora passalidarum NRRL Y-27907]
MVSTDSPVQIYFSNDVRKYLNHFKDSEKDELLLLGYKFNHIYIVFLPVKQIDLEKLPQELRDLQIIGTFSNTNKQANHAYDLNIKFDPRTDKIPKIISPSSSYVVFFDPPNFKNLEYFSITPILLESMKSDEEATTSGKIDYIALLEKWEPELHIDDNQFFISDDQILDKINHLYRNRLVFQKWWLAESGTHFLPSLFNSEQLNVIRPIKSAFTSLLIPITQFIQKLLITIIKIINFKFGKFSLVTLSKIFRQLDLRLQQFNYFPIQFLCYYNKNLLYNEQNGKSSSVIDRLKLPIFNSNLNINNSNYINLYNSIWLIFNDVLIGQAVYGLIEENFDDIVELIRRSIQRYLFQDMMELITWVSSKHPAGFKLNNELGKFMGDLYLWTLWFWKLVEENFQLSEPTRIKLFIKIICCFGGVSFLVSFLIDVMNVATYHIYTFYYCSTKIYKRQLEVIKSLFQLFRGKKYNVLRNRIDNLSTTQVNSSGFDFIDQLLLGTLIFMILILLLPTVFAFYLMFFLMHLVSIMTVNLLENIQILINFTPLFVILLKLKNSKRLQGGIKFEFLKYIPNTTYIKMKNKALTNGEIFTNFFKLFKRTKNFRNSIIYNFLSGELIVIKYDYLLKFHYLMLPDVYSETINVWKYLPRN